MAELKTKINPMDLADEYNGNQFVIKSVIKSLINTADVVRVLAVNDNRTLDVIPILSTVDANNNVIDESPVYGVHYLKYQAGGNVVDLTPEVGDIGILIAPKKDLSGLVAQGGTTLDGWAYSYANGLYIGGLFGFNKEPEQFIKFEKDTITLTGTGNLTINAKNVSVNAATVGIVAQMANIEAQAVNLGGEGGQPIARVGDTVKVGGVDGVITSGSQIVKSI